MHLVRYASVSPAVVHRLDFVHTAVHWSLNARARSASCCSTQWLLRVKPGVLTGAAVRSTEITRKRTPSWLGVFQRPQNPATLACQGVGEFPCPQDNPIFLSLIC